VPVPPHNVAARARIQACAYSGNDLKSGLDSLPAKTGKSGADAGQIRKFNSFNEYREGNYVRICGCLNLIREGLPTPRLAERLLLA